MRNQQNLIDTFHPTIPVLNLDDYYHQHSRHRFIEGLSQAFQDVGFVAIVNPGVEQYALETAYEQAQQFFSLPFEEKMRFHNPANNGSRGFVPSETAKGQLKKDFKEFFHVGHETSDDDLSKNIWPNQEFQQALMTLLDSLENHIIPIQQALADCIALPHSYFQTMTCGGDIKLRAINYPNNPPQNEMWAAAHTDIDLFTILPRATTQGLQVKNKEGQWIPIIVPEDAFVINVGDMLENITNGFFKSSQHRVVAEANSASRLSMVLFVHPKPNDDISPLPQCIELTGGIQRFPNATQSELLAERLVDLGLASLPTMQMLGQSKLIPQMIKLGRASPQVLRTLSKHGFLT